MRKSSSTPVSLSAGASRSPPGVTLGMSRSSTHASADIGVGDHSPMRGLPEMPVEMLMCPITNLVMQDPCVAADGISCEFKF